MSTDQPRRMSSKDLNIQSMLKDVGNPQDKMIFITDSAPHNSYYEVLAHKADFATNASGNILKAMEDILRSPLDNLPAPVPIDLDKVIALMDNAPHNHFYESCIDPLLPPYGRMPLPDGTIHTKKYTVTQDITVPHEGRRNKICKGCGHKYKKCTCKEI